MGRHSTGNNNLTIAPGVYIFLAVLVGLSLATCTWVRVIKSDDPTASGCIQGELVLPVASAANEKMITTKLIDAYNDTQPVVRDYCIKATYTESLAEAGAYVSTNSDGGIHRVLSTNERTATSSEWPVVDAIKVGISATETINKENLGDVTYPVADNAMASALVAASLNNNSATKVGELLNQSKAVTIDSAVSDGKAKIVTNELQVPPGYAFTEISDLTQPVRIVALNATNGVNEEVSRAGVDFGTASSNEEAAKTTTTLAAVAAAQALQAFEGEPTQAATPSSTSSAPSSRSEAVAGTPADTLYVLDTSDTMAGAAGDGHTWFSAASNAIAEAAPEVGETGHTVALWNYSSPLNPGVTRGWRRNVDFDDNDSGWTVASKAVGFSTGGSRHTRSTIVAALKYGVEHAQSTSKPVRVIVITTGNDDNLDVNTVIDEIATAKATNVELDMIHLGSDDTDQQIMDAAAQAATVTDWQDVAPAVDKASGL